MWWSDRRTLILGLAALAGCGFTPVYGPGGAAQGLRGAIRVAAPSDRNGFDFVARLEERLGLPEAAGYDLAYTLTTQAIGVGITPEQETTRYHLVGKASYTLTDARGVAVTSGEVEGFAAYAATGSPVAALTAAEDAGRRLMVILADRVVARLLATAGSWR